ncbi:hypothetical protein GF376_01820 [Candidatus Peregrinibacteria bacterium]|nr:hypothetical protein [Candidatus Peregrinibacteria bacterium]
MTNPTQAVAKQKKQKQLSSFENDKTPANPLKEIFVYDDLHPEDNAMLQALYSRSPNSVINHLDKVKGTGSGKFMEKFYVGYGHLSIADCGSTTLFIENVSMLLAKAIQDWPLYNGQEASTRYLDYSKQAILNPANTKSGEAIQKKWMDFYNKALPKVNEYLKTVFPIKDGENSKIYEKAIAARSFDIMRGFLPAGCTTYLSWHTNLRQAHEKLALLEHHPLQEVKETAVAIRAQLQEKYVNSFSHKKYPSQEDYWHTTVAEYSYFDPEHHPDFSSEHNINAQKLKPYQKALESRPIKTNLPLCVGEAGQFNFKFLLDFGSFRDIQRHRNGECKMPLLTTKFGFYPWYLEQLPEDVRKEAQTLIKEQEVKIDALTQDKYIKQYYIPMGYAIAVDVTYRLPAAIYVAELRSGKTVHPTLRKRAQQMGQSMKTAFPDIAVHLDMEESDWDIKRGQQDIVNKD